MEAVVGGLARLTWSFGGSASGPGFWRHFVARFEMTSLAFMLVWVPEPVCQTGSEVGIARTGFDLGRGGLDRFGDVLGQFAEAAIGLGRGPFLQAGRADHPRVEPGIADAEQVAGAFGLRAPVAIGGDLDGAEGVCFRAGGGHGPPARISRAP